MKKSSFVQQKKSQINKAIEFAINEHLSVLNSDIVLPYKKEKVNEIRLLATVISRDTVYNNLIAFLDDPEIDPSIKSKSQAKILSGLKKTMDELIEKIITRPMRLDSQVKDLINNSFSELEVDETSDDIISSISNAVRKAKDLVILINNRIALIENPDIIKEKINNQIIPSIAERYARNR